MNQADHFTYESQFSFLVNMGPAIINNKHIALRWLIKYHYMPDTQASKPPVQVCPTRPLLTLMAVKSRTFVQSKA